MVDANQKWDVEEAIQWMKELAFCRPLWIEEPTSPDDILGHAKIAEVRKIISLSVCGFYSHLTPEGEYFHVVS